jgi:N-acetylglucosamine-6-sulfatase
MPHRISSFRAQFPGSSSRQHRQSPCRTILQVEQLEDRLTPVVIPISGVDPSPALLSGPVEVPQEDCGCANKAAAGAAANSISTASAPEQPNIIVILTDDQRWDTLQYMQTVMSQLVGQGTNYLNAYVTTPLCCPSRFSILTGQYASNHGVRKNGGKDGGFGASRARDENSLAPWLNEAGYQTGFFGKYLNGYFGQEVPPGWDEWWATADDSAPYKNFRVVDRFLKHRTISAYYTDFFADKAIQFINQAESNDAQPFLVYYSTKAPHGPATPASRHVTVHPIFGRGYGLAAFL